MKEKAMNILIFSFFVTSIGLSAYMATWITNSMSMNAVQQAEVESDYIAIEDVENASASLYEIVRLKHEMVFIADEYILVRGGSFVQFRDPTPHWQFASWQERQTVNFLRTNFPSLFDYSTMNKNQEILNTLAHEERAFSYLDISNLPHDVLIKLTLNSENLIEVNSVYFPIGYEFYHLNHDEIPEVFIRYECHRSCCIRHGVYGFHRGNFERVGMLRDGDFYIDSLNRKLPDSYMYDIRETLQTLSIHSRFDQVRRFRDGMAAVNIGGSWHLNRQGGQVRYVWSGQGGKWGFVNDNYDLVIPLEFDDVGDFFDGLVFVVKDGKSGFIDKTGELVVPLIYEASVLCEESGISMTSDGRYLISRNGYFLPFFQYGLAVMVKDGQAGLIDHSGNVVVPFIYDADFHFGEWSWYLPEFHDGLMRLRKDGKYGVINHTGNIMIPFEFDWVGGFITGVVWKEDHLIRVSKNEKWGFVDRHGNVVVPIIYDFVTQFSEGMAAVMVGDYNWSPMWGFVDETGREVIPPQFEHVGDQWQGYAVFQDGVTAVMPTGNWNDTDAWVIIDKTGAKIMPLAEWDGIASFWRGGVEGTY